MKQNGNPSHTVACYFDATGCDRLSCKPRNSSPNNPLHSSCCPRICRAHPTTELTQSSRASHPFRQCRNPMPRMSMPPTPFLLILLDERQEQSRKHAMRTLRIMYEVRFNFFCQIWIVLIAVLDNLSVLQKCNTCTNIKGVRQVV